MAILARPTWVGIRDEVIKRCGTIVASGFSSRVERFCWSAYLELATTFHHFELDTVDTSITLSTSANSVSLPADCFIVTGFILKNAAGSTILGEVQEGDPRRVTAAYLADSGQPTKRARFGAKLYFDKKPDLTYKSELYYYRYPASPDFTTPTSPELGSDLDERIIQAAVSLVSSAVKDVDFSAVNRQLLGEWLGTQVRNPAQVPLVDNRERRATQTTLGGAQG